MGASVRADRSFQAAAKRLGFTGVNLYCEPTVQGGRALADELSEQHPEVTGLIDMNSEAIIGFMQVAQGSIPKRLSVVSIAASDQLANATLPALTTIAPPAGAMGRTAAQLLIAQVSGQELPDGPRLFTGDLVERGSSGPAPRRK